MRGYGLVDAAEWSWARPTGPYSLVPVALVEGGTVCLGKAVAVNVTVTVTSMQLFTGKILTGYFSHKKRAISTAENL